jgi:hypothetical protein
MRACNSTGTEGVSSSRRRPPPAALPLNLLRIDPNTMDQPLHLMAA